MNTLMRLISIYAKLSDIKKHITYFTTREGITISDYINQRNQYGETPLMIAVRHGGYRLVKFLLDAGADVNKQSNSGRTALIIAVSQGNIKLVELLLKYNASINLLCISGYDALHFAKLYNSSKKALFIEKLFDNSRTTVL
jgi:ankyrin repeat protein